MTLLYGDSKQSFKGGHTHGRQITLVGGSGCYSSSALPIQHLNAGTELKYQKPPEPIERLLNAPVTPVADLSPDRRLLLI